MMVPPRCCGVAGAADGEAGFVGQRDQALGLALGFFADGGDADFVDDLVAGARGVHRRDVRRAVEEAADVGRVVDGAVDELEGMRVRGPAGGGGLQLRVEICADVEIARAGAAEQPLHRAAGGEVDVEGGHVERHDAGGLVEVGDDVGADLVGAFGDGGEVLQVGAAEGHVRDADKLGLLVDGGEDVFERDGHAVGRGNGDDLGALPLEPVVDVVVRGEVEAVGDELVARAAPVEAGGDDGLADGDVLVHDDAAFGRADDGADEVAAGDGHVPPAFFPGADAAGGPGVGELLQRSLRRGAAWGPASG